MIVENGVGNADKMKVDGSNRARTFSVTVPDNEDATKREDSYNINSGLVTLTGVDEQGILYVKNNETRDLVVVSLIIILGPSTSGSSDDTTRVRVYKNPTTGTLISEQTAADTSSNRNFGSSKTLTADVYKGDGSATVTDGSVHIETLVSPGTRAPIGIDEIIPQGKSIAITYEPNDSNTSMKCMAAIVCHLADPNGD